MFEKIFQLDPDDRITAEKALAHPFFGHFHDPEDEPNGTLLEDKFEYENHTLDEWKSIFYS